MLSHAYYIVIDLGVGAPGNGKEALDGLNDTDIFFLKCDENFATSCCSH